MRLIVANIHFTISIFAKQKFLISNAEVFGFREVPPISEGRSSRVEWRRSRLSAMKSFSRFHSEIYGIAPTVAPPWRGQLRDFRRRQKIGLSRSESFGDEKQATIRRWSELDAGSRKPKTRAA